jgi:DNA-directed RNA polymerase subunit RPC12/RpoP
MNISKAHLRTNNMDYRDTSSTLIKTPVDFEVEREKQGYELLKDDTIKCGNCSKPLISVIKVREEDTTTNIKATCPYCNDSSFWYQIKGKIFIQAVEGLAMADMPMKIQNGIQFTTIKVVKDGKK